MIFGFFLVCLFTDMGAISDTPRSMDLSEWVSAALSSSPEIRSSEASVISARAFLTGDQAFLYPSLTASAGVTRAWSNSPLPDEGSVRSETDSWSAGLSLSQEILRSGGQNWLYRNASRLEFAAAEADHEGAVLQVTLDVVYAYYDVIEAIKLRQAAENSLERTRGQLARTQALYDMGAVTTLELLQVQVQESEDRLLAGRREQALQTAYGNLYIAAGADLSGPVMLVDTNAVLEPLPMESVALIPGDHSQNQSLRAARFRQEASGIRADAAGRSYWPTLRASAGWNWNDDTLDDIDRMFDSHGYNVGLSLSWTVFDGFLRESQIKSSRAAEISSQASLESLEDQLASTERTLRTTLELDVRYYRDSMLALERAQEQYRLSSMSYDMGAISLLDLLDAQSDLASAEANLAGARVAALKTEASLMVLLGNPPRLGE
ncbi:MAG TPA: TolC family protein [Candidatus Sabulitectum sp.]|nr:TolC family protein [Candidatus Sabulitectum sp.]